jgi:flagellar basal body-associated protein FliL
MPSAASPTPAPPAPSARKPRRVLLILTWCALGVALIASGAATWLLFFNGPRAEAVATVPMHVVRAGTIVVNVPNTDGRRYLRATLELAATTPKDLKRLNAERVRVVDAAIGVLSSTDLATLLDHTRREELKNALKAKLNETLGGRPVAQVFFTEFVIQ